MSKDQKFSLTLKGGSISINEMEIDATTAAKVMRLAFPLSESGMRTFPDIRGAVHDPVGQEEEIVPGSVSPKQFMAQKQPKSDMERITCLAFYLTNFQKIQSFKTVDLTHLNAEAAQPKFSNASVTARNTVSQQYFALAPAGGGKKQITARGEALVNALPDRGAVQEALVKHHLLGRKGKKKGKKS